MKSSIAGRGPSSRRSSRAHLQSFQQSSLRQTQHTAQFVAFDDKEVQKMSDVDSFVGGVDHEDDSSMDIDDDTEYTQTKKESTEASSSQEISGPLGKSANLAVNRSKRLVYLVLTLVTGGFAVAVFFLISHEENSTFESKFADFAQEILASADSNAKDYLGRYQGISNTLTSYSIDNGATWPNVTLPHFTIRMTESFEKVAGAELYIFAPMVTKPNLKRYERYAWDHQVWIEEDLELRGLGKVDPGFIPSRVYPHGGAAAGLEEHLSAKLHVPIWEVAPVPTDAKIVNLDLYSHPSFQRMIEESLQVRHTLLSEVVDRTFISENIQTLDSNALTDKDPRSYAVEPVYQDFAWDSDIVGFIFAVVPWFTYFLNILPPGTNNYIVEVQDSCGHPFYYKLDGPDAMLIDDKNFKPNPAYAHLTQSAEFAEFARFDGDTISDNILHCTYRLVVHPTDALKKEYQSSDPVVYTLVVLAVFGLTVLTFVLYNYFVQRRQERVMWAAERTAAIVSSLFPKNIQSKLMKEAMRDDSSISRRRSFSGKDMLKSFLGSDRDNAPAADENSIAWDTKPIADFFPETSILFGDIVGFTAWSSTREPSQVFKLLETIYHEFDQVATRRRVFKVETVGDCYVTDILPLAEKLKECGVFGVSSEEYLQYATNNRNEWERRGEEAIMELRRNLSETGRLLPEDEPPPLKFVRSLFQGQGGLPPKNQQALAPLPGPLPPAAAPATESVVKFQSTEESDVADKDRDDARTGDLLQEEGSETSDSDAYPSNVTLSSERRPETFGNDVEC